MSGLREHYPPCIPSHDERFFSRSFQLTGCPSIFPEPSIRSQSKTSNQNPPLNFVTTRSVLMIYIDMLQSLQSLINSVAILTQHQRKYLPKNICPRTITILLVKCGFVSFTIHKYLCTEATYFQA